MPSRTVMQLSEYSLECLRRDGDDDELFRRSIARLGRSAGFRVETFGSAEDFLERGDMDRTACAILDMKLPDMNGLDLQQRLITTPTPIPIVFVSAHDEAMMQANALARARSRF